MSSSWDVAGSSSLGDLHSSGRGTAGKRTLSEQLPVQRRGVASAAVGRRAEPATAGGEATAFADPFAMHLVAAPPVVQRKPLAEAIAAGQGSEVMGESPDGVEGEIRPEMARASLASEEAEGSGQPLPEDVRAQMEQAFGVDFSAVRIHVGSKATQLGALAYTQGTKIYFAPGQYQPHSKQGQELLGHELAHVVQQAQGRVKPTSKVQGAEVNDDAGLEQEADEQGSKAANGEKASGGGAGESATPSGPAPASGGEATQLKKVNEAVAGAAVVTASSSKQWMIVQGLDSFGAAGWHLTIFPSKQETWKGTYALPAVGTRGVGAWMEYDEFHLTSPEKKHFYYTEAFAPLKYCMSTGAKSPAWTDASWAAANQVCASYFGLGEAGKKWLDDYVGAMPAWEAEQAAEQRHQEHMFSLYSNWVAQHPEMYDKEKTTFEQYVERLEGGFQGTHQQFRDKLAQEHRERGNKLPVYPKRKWRDDAGGYGYYD